MIGETFWVYDGNRRIYENPDGSRRSSPWPRGHYRQIRIDGETRTSWTAGALKIDKKTMRLRGDHIALDSQVYTAEQVEDNLWRTEHKYKIVSLVDAADTPTLRKIAALIGYDP